MTRKEKFMRRRTLAIVTGIALGMCITSVPVRADGPEVGFNAGVAVPLKKYSHTVEGVGGTVGLSGGYRFNLTDNLALSLLGNPQFSFFGTEEGCCGLGSKGDSDDIGSIFSITGGPKLSFLADGFEAYAGGQGGYYRDMSRPLSDEGPGYNIDAGFNFEIARNTSLGVFGRYDVAYMTPEAGTNGAQRKWVSGGLAFTYVFQPEEVAVAPPPPPPPPPPPAVRPPPPPPPPTQRRGG
jgi:hypothetical protein